MNSRASRVLKLMPFLFLSHRAAVKAEVYQNDQYGYAFNIPKNIAVCRTDAPAPDHGIRILFSQQGCEDDRRVSEIDVFVSFNVPYEAQNSTQLGEKLCDTHVGRPTRSRVSGRQVYRCAETDNRTVAHRSWYVLFSAPSNPASSWVYVVIDTYSDLRHKHAVQLATAKVIGSLR